MSKLSENSQTQRFEELLTPYVQGQLDDKTRREVEQYAETSSSFAELLDFERQIAGSVKKSPVESVAVLPSFGKLKQRIDSQQKPEAGFKFFLARVSDVFGGANGALVAASLALLAVVLVTVQRPNTEANLEDFVTLSDDADTVQAVPGRQYFQVVFAEEIRSADVERLADELQFAVEAGPNRFGAYTVSTETDANSAHSRAENWREDNRFVFVETKRLEASP